MKRVLFLCAGLMLAGPARALMPVESTRAKVESLRAETSQVRQEQMRLRQELTTVAGRIETLKARHSGAVVPGSELSVTLSRSVELSDALGSLAQKMATLESQLSSARQAHLAELSTEWNRLRQMLEREPDRTKRQEWLRLMRSLRVEREQLRAALPQSALPQGDLTLDASDPEALLEQADVMRDREEKVRRELKALEARIAERREERELERRMSDFLSDEALFDDQDRRFRLTRQLSAPAAEESTNAPQDTSADGPVMSSGTGSDFGVSSTPAPSGPSPAPAPSPAPSRTASPSYVSGNDARPVIGNGLSAVRPEDEDLEQLLSQKTRLLGLAEELKGKAQKLEQQAREAK